MHTLGSARVVFNIPEVSVWLRSLRHPRLSRSFRVSYSRSITTQATNGSHREFTSIPSDLFEYTSGRWLFNDDLRHAERKRVFKVNELTRLAAEAVNRSPDDIRHLEKLAEGGFNRTFLITMRCGFRMVARIPYTITVPKYFAVASEVATMAFLRSSGLPVPEIYGYSPTPDNAAGTEYIFMEYVQGTKLSDTWFDLGEEEISSISRQIAELESKMMSIRFPAGGSLYYTEDLENAAGSATRPGIALEDKRFSVGPDTRMPLWSGRRSELDLDRGPYKDAEAALLRGAEKELAYLHQFGRPLLPFNRMRREAYKYQKQPPSDHIENLNRYLLIAPSLVPRHPVLNQFCIRHPDLQPSNILISSAPRSDLPELPIASVIDWQHTSILPLFLHTGIPQELQNYNDPASQDMTPPRLPENLHEMDENQTIKELEIYRRRLVHYYYLKTMEEYNPTHYAAMRYPTNTLRRRLFHHSSDPWEGDTVPLKVALIAAEKYWSFLAEGADSPCPIAFDPKDVEETMRKDAEQQKADETLEACRNGIGFGTDGWVPTENYEEAMAMGKQLKEGALAAAAEESEEIRAEIAAHWPLDDMDEEEYM